MSSCWLYKKLWEISKNFQKMCKLCLIFSFKKMKFLYLLIKIHFLSSFHDTNWNVIASLWHREANNKYLFSFSPFFLLHRGGNYTKKNTWEIGNSRCMHTWKLHSYSRFINILFRTFFAKEIFFFNSLRRAWNEQLW